MPSSPLRLNLSKQNCYGGLTSLVETQMTLERRLDPGQREEMARDSSPFSLQFTPGWRQGPPKATLLTWQLVSRLLNQKLNRIMVKANKQANSTKS